MNLARDHFRAIARRGIATDPRATEDLPPAEPGAEFAAMRNGSATCFGHYVLQLPGPQREAVALRDIGGLDHAQIARIAAFRRAMRASCCTADAPPCAGYWKERCILSFDDRIPCDPRPLDR